MAITTESLEDAIGRRLGTLSLRDETLLEGSTPPQAGNPSEELLNAPRQRNQLEVFLQDCFLPSLQTQRQLRRVTPDDPFFQRARDIWESRGWNGEGLSNYITLLCGILNFPAILLLNPSFWDFLPWDKMIQNSPTLAWIQEVLGRWGLSLRDIIVIDAVPLLTDQKMDAMDNTEREQFANEVFKLTVEFIRHFDVQVMISCQCATTPSHRRWGIVNDPFAAQLCSSVSGARRQDVATVYLQDRTLRVIQGFHPMHIRRTEDPDARSSLDGVLRGLFDTIFQPCADWQAQRHRERGECEETLHSAADEVRGAMVTFFNTIRAYRACQRQAIRLGTGSARRGNDFDVPQWQRDVSSIVSMLLPGPLSA
ncbi:DNA polymerase zeta catalytic subunit [Aspergillus terreus]|uniref:DNA polymerase zeta catalytic subunit n=1 Tax=Aspergillus terreus TaxID=33178 RepID=A0A5M3YNX3_ASPTE|nr:hypothetical protein ATETN484_0002029300 [Aspergillus terreus]GFF15149.1 DNA polymerase zeta catalytic subunit [Aspergillus terreus]